MSLRTVIIPHMKRTGTQHKSGMIARGGAIRDAGKGIGCRSDKTENFCPHLKPNRVHHRRCSFRFCPSIKPMASRAAMPGGNKPTGAREDTMRRVYSWPALATGPIATAGHAVTVSCAGFGKTGDGHRSKRSRSQTLIGCVSGSSPMAQFSGRSKFQTEPARSRISCSVMPTRVAIPALSSKTQVRLDSPPISQ